MSRYIDADKLTVYFEALAKQAEMEGLHNMAHIHNRCLQIIEDAPTADVVEVVRCENCRHYHKEKGGWCERHDFEFDVGDYCSYGERREG